jgi:hypothetical protein
MKQRMHKVLRFAPLGIATLMLATTAIVAWAQNTVPPTAREAASLPQFAARLAHPDTASQHKPSPLAPAGISSPLLYQVLYENGPVNSNTNAWQINFGHVVSDSFTNGSGSAVRGFDFWVWKFPGDNLSSVDWSITSAENGGTVYGSGTANVVDTFISTNIYGFDIDHISVTDLNVSAKGNIWLNLGNAVVSYDDPIYWDENSGRGCHSQGCPSQAYENTLGTIPSESFDITDDKPSAPAVASNTDGRLEVFVRGSDNALYHRSQAVAGGPDWNGWTSFGGVLTSDPTVAQNADGRLEVFIVGGDSALWHKSQTAASGSTWSSWSTLGGGLIGDIAVGQNSDGRLEVFAHGSDNALYHRSQAVAGGLDWKEWTSLGGVLENDRLGVKSAMRWPVRFQNETPPMK